MRRKSKSDKKTKDTRKSDWGKYSHSYEIHFEWYYVMKKIVIIFWESVCVIMSDWGGNPHWKRDYWLDWQFPPGDSSSSKEIWLFHQTKSPNIIQDKLRTNRNVGRLILVLNSNLLCLWNFWNMPSRWELLQNSWSGKGNIVLITHIRWSHSTEEWI